MSKSTVIKIILKAVVIPVIVVFGLSKFNLFEYITFVPEDYQYDIGLTVYLALIEGIFELADTLMEQKKATIKCVFYKSDVDEDISNTPLVICDRSTGVAIINCHLELSGNIKRLRRCKLNLVLPSWLTSQANASDTVLGYVTNQLTWEFDRLLPSSGINGQFTNYKNKISLIKSATGDNLSIQLEPQIKKVLGIKFETNGFRVQNGE